MIILIRQINFNLKNAIPTTTKSLNAVVLWLLIKQKQQSIKKIYWRCLKNLKTKLSLLTLYLFNKPKFSKIKQDKKLLVVLWI